MQPALLILLCVLALLEAGCACAPLGSRTMPTGEDKYSAKYD